MENYLLGCDWGTSSFRLGLYHLFDHTLIDEIQSGEGISEIHKAWVSANFEGVQTKKDLLFKQKLLEQVKKLSHKLSMNLDNILIVISGMASSSIGMEDIPYAKLPFALDGSQVNTRWYPSTENFPHHILLISGVQTAKDVMRGEETQLIGLLSLLGLQGTVSGAAVFVFPGTHSKHIYINNGELIDINSFMTGEMFSIIGKYSILKDSITQDDDNNFSGNNLQAFKLGLQEAGRSCILNGLFTVRTNQLFKKMDKNENAFYLSGLLIGTELNELVKNKDHSLFLCSGSRLFNLYEVGIRELNLAGRTTFISKEIVDKAALAGQVLIYNQLLTGKSAA